MWFMKLVVYWLYCCLSVVSYHVYKLCIHVALWTHFIKVAKDVLKIKKNLP